MDIPPLSGLSKTQERALLAGLILLGWAFIVLARLFTVQVLEHDSLSKLARRQQERLEAIEAPRGAIFDRNGSILAISSNSHMGVVNPRRIPNKEMAAALLAGILHQDAAQLEGYFDKAAASRSRGGYLVVDNRSQTNKPPVWTGCISTGLRSANRVCGVTRMARWQRISWAMWIGRAKAWPASN